MRKGFTLVKAARLAQVQWCSSFERVKGFTLVELMVVIAIIAILSTIGFGVYGTVQKAGRDAKRKADIDAIASALEVNKTPTGYQAIVPTWFASGAISYDPNASSVTDIIVVGCGTTSPQNQCWYCLRDSANYCDPSAPGNNHLNITDFTAYVSSWYVCANLENGSPAYYCRSSVQ